MVRTGTLSCRGVRLAGEMTARTRKPSSTPPEAPMRLKCSLDSTET